VRPELRHLLLLVRERGEKHKLRCGHDEGRWFVAGLPESAPVGTVRQALEALKPVEVQARQAGVRARDRRHGKDAANVRQGEWFCQPTDIEPDPQRVLANVLDNAFRHGGGAGVVVRGAAARDHVRCDVVDSGPGVPPGSPLFAPFTRLDGHGPGPHGDRAAGGLGLGLSVARGFAEAMGGTLEALPTPGGGLTVRLTLPVARP